MPPMSNLASLRADARLLRRMLVVQLMLTVVIAAKLFLRDGV